MSGETYGPKVHFEGPDELVVESGGSLTVRAGGIASFSDGLRLGDAAASFLGLGAAEECTIAAGVLTVTKPFVIALPESSTADQVDSIVYDGAQEGDLLLITSPATNTITVDDAAINLGAGTRAVAPGGCLLLYFDGTQWTELAFLAGADNS